MIVYSYVHKEFNDSVSFILDYQEKYEQVRKEWEEQGRKVMQALTARINEALPEYTVPPKQAEGENHYYQLYKNSPAWGGKGDIHFEMLMDGKRYFYKVISPATKMRFTVHVEGAAETEYLDELSGNGIIDDADYGDENEIFDFSNEAAAEESIDSIVEIFKALDEKYARSIEDSVERVEASHIG